MKQVNVGIIGAGFVGQLAHIDNYKEVGGCRLVALAELRPKLRSLVSERYHISRTYENHLELLKDPEVEAVVAVTQRHLIGPIALDCLTAGKHVITEKPMASTLEQAEKIVKMAKENGVKYVVGYMRRHDEGIEKAKQIMDELLSTGELGDLIYIRNHCFEGYDYCNISGHIATDEKIPEGRAEWPIAPDWIPEILKKEYARFLNVYCHNINLLRYFLGGTPSLEYVNLRGNAKLIVFNFNNCPIVLEGGNLSYYGWDESIEIYFANGYLKVTPPPSMLRNVSAKVELYKGNNIHQTYTFHCGWTWAFKRQAENFIKDIQENRQPLASGEDALEDMRLIEDIWRMELKTNSNKVLQH